MTTTPNMTLVLPVPSTTAGPLYAQQEVTAFNLVDAHDHTSGRGVPVPTAGLNINADLPIGSNNINGIRSLRLDSQSATLIGSGDVRILYSKNGELAYRDSAGNEVIMTASGSVAGATGTITGLSSPASAAFSSVTHTFTFSKDSSKPGKLAISDINLYEYDNATANAITVKSPASLASAYTLTLPTAVPAAAAYVSMDASGNLGFSAVGIVPVGAVLATFKGLTGAYSCVATTAADVNGYVLCGGQTIADGTSPMNGVVIPNINNSVFLMGSTSSNSSGGANAINLNHSHTVNSHSHGIAHVHQWSWFSGTNGALHTPFSADPTFSAIGAGSPSLYTESNNFNTSSGSSRALFSASGVSAVSLYTTGVTSSASGSGSTAASDVSSPGTDSALSSSQDNRPAYITSVYIMRVK